ncbi:unnamed protein product [Euphydryas editha]|uniref:Uncharacterized protein n=1 Tax=Euphydryas editha TaxID=104508 RepID=A0AAU9UZV8_EUPED|nr:unnamed protein product [Euphydryas editha]
MCGDRTRDALATSASCFTMVPMSSSDEDGQQHLGCDKVSSAKLSEELALEQSGPDEIYPPTYTIPNAIWLRAIQTGTAK